MATRNNLQSGDKRQSKTLLLTILDLRSSVVLTFSIAAYLKCLLNIGLLNTYSQNNPKQGLLGIIYIFHGSVEKNNFASTPDIRQSKTILTIEGRGSEIATTRVFDCQLSPVGRLKAIKNYVSNYFLSTFVDNIDVFDCRISCVNSLYAS